MHVLQDLLGLSESQAQDLLAIRETYACRIGHLTSERTALLQRMCQHSHQLSEMRILAAQLQANITETHDGYLQYATALYLGVRPRQPHHKQPCELWGCWPQGSVGHVQHTKQVLPSTLLLFGVSGGCQAAKRLRWPTWKTWQVLARMCDAHRGKENTKLFSVL